MVLIQIGDPGEHEVLDVPRDIVEHSVTLKNMLEDCDDDSEDPIPIPEKNVSYETYKKIVEYYKNRPEGYKFEVIEVETAWLKLHEYDKTFISSFETKDLSFVTLAANYLETKDLLEVCCIRYAELIKQTNVEGIKKMFDIKDNLEPENHITEEEKEDHGTDEEKVTEEERTSKMEEVD